jgi:hypothetical protein
LRPPRFHAAAFATAIVPLAAGYSEPAVLPSGTQAALLLGIACGSFGGNLLGGWRRKEV